MQKKLAFLFVFLSLVLTIGAVPAQASNRYSLVPTSGTPSPTKDFAASTTGTSKAAVGLGACTDTIAYNGNAVLLFGETIATHTASKIGNQIIMLQAWDGNAWITVYSTSFYKQNTMMYSSGVTYNPVKGKYYRVAGIHMATINGTTYTSATNYTDYIYVN